MNTFLRRAVALAFCSFFLMTVSAQEVKIGVVNLERVLRDAPAAKVAQENLIKEFAKRDKELVALRSEIRTLAANFEKDSPTLPESERLVRQRQLIEQDRELQRKNREFQDDLNARRAEETQRIIDLASKAVREIAAAEKYDIIFQDIVYVNPKLNMTDKVIKALNLPAGK